LALAALLLLLAIGPAHLWHHWIAAESPGEHSHCLPCSAFQHSHFVSTVAGTPIGDSDGFETVASFASARVLAPHACVDGSRAPPFSA
jgi:hypothetical protein